MKNTRNTLAGRAAPTLASLLVVLSLAACAARPTPAAVVTAPPPTEPPTQTPWVVTSAPPTATAQPTATGEPATATATGRPTASTGEATPDPAAPASTVLPVRTAAPVVAKPVPVITATSALTTQLALPLPPGLDKTDNILVLGADVRPGRWMPHTDSIMVMAVDHETKQVGIVSIPRDLYVNIPGWGDDRINSAAYVGDQIKYPGGGPALAREMVEETTGIPTQHYVLIRMEGLERLVDALGGITVTLDCPLYEQTPDPKDQTKTVNWSLPAGPNFLNGKDARKFATYRYIQTDFGRVRRQQQLIWAIRNRALQINVIPRIPELWSALQDTFKTDLGPLDIARLAALGMEMDPRNVHGTVLDQEVMAPWTTPGGGSVLVVKDPAVLQTKLAGLFAAQPISELGKKQGPKCPPAPPGFKDLNPTPEPTATPPPTPVETATPQS
jgi:polyisoprenyl-teichoic acid--peptidoglycan teichoic acid transferase